MERVDKTRFVNRRFVRNCRIISFLPDFTGWAGLKGFMVGVAAFAGFLLKLLLTAESFGNGFSFDSPMTAFLSFSHKPSHCRCSANENPDTQSWFPQHRGGP